MGRPNAGKSTLLNALCKSKVSIVSSKPQTTRTRITGIVNSDDCQLVFIDTPGLHKARNRLGDFMTKVIEDTVADVDAAILIVEPVARIGIPDQKLIEKIKAARALGKRNFIVLVSEGVGSDYAPALAKKIQNETGVETKFARLAHVVRGGTPTLKDRVLASRMGVAAVDQLLLGNSNLVICERHGDIVATEIGYALTADMMNKNIEVTAEQLAVFSPEEIEGMKALVEERRSDIKYLYDVASTINL